MKNLITINKNIRTACPDLQLGLLSCKVNVEPTSGGLAERIANSLEELQSRLEVPQISQLPIAQETRRGYKATGKDPARYRPSAEALLRRVIKGKGLYKINNVVDALNLISVETAYSIGGYDMDNIQGNIKLGIGEANEPYEGIGRGELNIKGLATLRDDLGAFGTPTSDSARTSVSENTKRFLMVFYNFEGSNLLEGALDKTATLYREHLRAEDVQMAIV
ncbi:MAG: B3/4 domain-containing protein [Saprospiraceae bacterium]